MKNILGVTLVIFAATALAFGQCSDSDKRMLQDWDKKLGDAGRAGDRAFLQSAYADDYSGLAPWGAVNKTTTIDNTVKAAARSSATSQGTPTVKYDYYDITCSGDLAVMTHRTASTASPDGKERTTYSRSVHILKKRSDGWQMISNAGSPLDDGGILLYMEREWNDASKSRDVSWFERNYAYDVSDIGSRTGALHTKAEELDSVKNDKSVLDTLELSEMNVRVEGNIAIVTGVNHVSGRDEKGKPLDERVRFTDVYVKRDGRWLVLATQGTAIK